MGAFYGYREFKIGSSISYLEYIYTGMISRSNEQLKKTNYTLKKS